MTRPAARVLVVDDNQGWAAIAVEALEGAGCVVAHAAAADRGVVLARTHTPDVVLVALDLPGAAEAVADRVASRGARLVGVVGVVDDAARARAERLALDGLLARSLDEQALLAAALS